MTKTTFICFFFFVSVTVNAQLTYIPDDGFEQYLETTFPLVNNGLVNDNYILSSGIPSITFISLSGMLGNTVNDFTGIGSFTSLQGIQLLNMTTINADLSSLNNNLTGLINYFQVTIEQCNNITNIILPNNNIRISIKYNPILQNIVFQNSNVFCSFNAIQNNNTIQTIDLSNTAGVYPGASLWVSGNTSLQCFRIDNGQCNNWQGVMSMPNGIADVNTPLGTLYCVQVDNPAYSEVAGNWSFSGANIPSTYYYSTNCNCTASIAESSTRANFSIHPNPSNGEMTIVLEKNIGKVPYSIYDQQGRMVKSGMLDGSKTHIRADLNNGLYYLKAGEQVVKLQVVK